MNCKKCGFLLTVEDQFCKNCGTPVNEESVQNPIQSNTQTIEQTNVANNLQQSISNNISNQSETISPTQQPTINTVANQTGITAPIQQSVMQSTGQVQPQTNVVSKNNSTKFIILGIVIVILVGAFVMISVLFGGKNAGNNPSAETNKSVYKVNFKNFIFSIPDNYVYEQGENALSIGNEEGTWAMTIELLEGSFSQLKANKNQLKQNIQQAGYTASSPLEKTIKEVPFISLEISQSGQNAIMAVAKANSMYVVVITAFNQENEFDYSLLDIVAPIVKTAEHNSKTNNMKVSDFDMSIISEIAK